MKSSSISLGILALAGAAILATSCNQNTNNEGSAAPAQETSAQAGAIVYFNLDRVLAEYDMAIDLSSVVETKVNSINQEVNRRGTKLEKDVRAFEEKINKGLLTQSVAQQQQQKLIEQQNEFQTYANQKQQEIVEEQNVLMNQIADAINTYIQEFNAEKKYAMILATQGDILPAPVVTADPDLDITDALLEGLNAAYVKSKGE